jgi:hypothetical protein
VSVQDMWSRIKRVPWSKSSPKGLDELVRLACLPSTASNVCNILFFYKTTYQINISRILIATRDYSFYQHKSWQELVPSGLKLMTR